MTISPLDTLAYFGAPPAFPEKLHVGRPNIGDRARLLARIDDLLDRRWLTNDGPYVREFERRVAERLGVRNCVAVSSGTVALELAIRALGLHGEVIVPALTFVATAHALAWQGIRPVFCDIDPATHTLDPRRVAELITPRTSGIIGVHLWGRGCPMAELEGVARRSNLRLLYDAAHAFGCSVGGRPIGGFGDAEVFSFHATKVVNTLEGGAVVTGDDALADRLRRMRNFGFAGFDTVVSIGTNGKLNEVSAAMGLTSLESMDEFVAANERNYRQYRRELDGMDGVTLLAYDERERNTYQYIVLEVDEAAAGVSRDALLAVLWAEGVLARRYFYPGCHRMEPYRSQDPQAGRRLPATERLVERLLQLPTGTSVGPKQVRTICSIIRTAVAHSRALAARMETQKRM